MSQEESNEAREPDLLKHIIRLEQRLDALTTRMELLEGSRQNLQGTHYEMSSEGAVKPPPLPKERSFPSPSKGEPFSRDVIPAPVPKAASAVSEGHPAGNAAAAGTKEDWSIPLRRWGLLPPANSGSFEVQVGAWWATRVGTLLAVIGVVFFGIYLTQGTPAWVKWLQLFAVSGGITFLGYRLERKFEKFGAVIFGGGLSLLYFTAFSAYAIPAVKVVDHMALAGALQAAAILFIVACSLWRNSRSLASLALFFGFITCFFSSYAKLDDFALFASLLLCTGGVFFFLKKQWSEPLQVAVPLAYLLFAWVFVSGWLPLREVEGMGPSLFLGLGYLLVCFGLFAAADYTSLVWGNVMPAGRRRFLQTLNKAGATFLGFAFVFTFFREHLTFFFFLYSFVFLGTGFAYFRRARPDEMTSIHAASGVALFSLGLVESLDAYALWISLAVQSMVLLIAARRTGLKVMELGASFVWITSVLFFAWDVIPGDFIAAGPLTRETSPLFSVEGIASVGFLVFSAFLLCLGTKWLGSAEDGGEIIPSRLATESLTVRGNVLLLHSALLGLVGLLIGAFYFPLDFFSFGASLAVVLLVASGIVFRHWIAILAATLPFLFAHANLWFPVFPEAPAGVVWLNGGSIMIVSVFAALAVYRDEAYRLPLKDASQSGEGKWLLWVPHLLWIFSLQVLFYKLFSLELYLFLAVAVSLLLAGAAHRLSFRGLADLSFVPMGLAAGGYLTALAGGSQRLPATDNLWLLWSAVAGGFVFACLQGVSTVLNQKREAISAKDGEGISTALATALGLYALWVSFSGGALMAAAAVSALGVAALSQWPGLKSAFFAAAAVLVFAHGAFYSLLLGPTTLGYLIYSLLLAVLTIAYVLRTPYEKEGAAVPLQWLFGSLTLTLLFFLFLTRGGGLQPYVTVFWGLSALAVFLTGLLANMKPLRVIGLAGLAICIPRVFFIDIQSALYRIVAFGVMGAVLMGVGFLYHKYKEVIGKGEEKKVAGPYI
ncbi:MAG: hypothetical protein WD490_08530 [Opitutales bacterium]